MSNWSEAVQAHEDRKLLAFVAALVCGKCGAANRPGATYVELETPTRAVCGVCAHAFNPHFQEHTS